jgi:endonuclease/exonuclease/phosphatase family metal-dependent hydrolase
MSDEGPYGALLEGRLRVLTWNLWWRFGPWEARQPAILETLRELDADIVTVQEAWSTADRQDQVATLAAALRLDAAAAWTDKTPTEQVGNGILSRWRILRTVRAEVPVAEGHERRALLAVVDSPAGPLTVVTTHLSARHDESAVRQRQVAAVARPPSQKRAAEHTGPLPPILTGDLNATAEADEIRMLLGHTAAVVPNVVFTDAWQEAGEGPGHTWSRANPYVADSAWPERRLDYILCCQPPQGGDDLPPVRPHFRAARCRLVGVEPVGGGQPSDHYGVAADLVVHAK